MNYYELLNAGVEPSGTLDFVGVVKWVLGLLLIFVAVQNYIWVKYIFIHITVLSQNVTGC